MVVSSWVIRLVGVEGGTFHSFGHQSFRRLWLSNLVSSMSQMMQMTLLVWFVLERTDSPFLVALVGTFSFAPTLLLGVFGGLLADRVDRRRLLLTTQSVNLAAALTFTLLLNTDLVEIWHAYVIMLVGGSGWALDSPSRRSIIHDLLGNSFVTNGMALDSVGMHFSWMVAPALAGGLIAWTSVGGGYVVVTVLYVAAVALVLSLKLPYQAAPLQRTGGAHPEAKAPGQATGAGRRRRFLSSAPDVFRNLGEGFRYVRGHETIRATILITLLMNLLFYPYMQMGPVIARDVLGVGPGLMGILMSAPGIAALFGAVAIASAGGLRHQGRVYIAGTMLAMTGLLLFSFSTRYAVAFPLMLMLGLGAAGFGTMQATIVMLVARKDMRGRALGVISLAIGSMPLGMLMTGTVASATSPSFAVGLNAAVGLGLVVLVGSLMPSLRRPIVAREETEPLATGPLHRTATTD